MLQITVPGAECWDSKKEKFIQEPPVVLCLEHSLVSLSKWEQKWCKPFLKKEPKTREETLDYIRCMTLTQNVDPSVYFRLSESNINEINKYIESPMTATIVSEDKNHPKNHEIITSELIYYWMVALQIPFECQKWHLNRLITLIKVCNKKNTPPKKSSTKQLYDKHRAINEANKKRFHSKG